MRRIPTTIVGCFFATVILGQEWNTVGDIYNANPMWNVSIKDFSIQGDSLWIGGAFLEIGIPGDTIVTRGLMHWDSLEITGFLADFNHAIEGYEGDLIIGGGNLGELDEWGIAGYDGESWYSLQGGTTSLTNTVRDLLQWEGMLYACGDFEGMGQINNPGIAAWNGDEWIDVGWILGFGDPYCMEVFQGELYVGGDIDSFSPPTTLSQGICRWNGSSWNDVGGGIFGYINAMEADTVNDLLYVGGWIFTVGEDQIEAETVAAWDGEEWQAVAEIGFNSSVFSMCMYRGQLYVGGPFDQLSDGTPMNHIARFDGVNWQSVGGGLEGWPHCMEVYKDELYVGGSFTMAGNTEVTSLARWYLHPDSVTWGVPDTADFIFDHPYPDNQELFQLFPNPTNGRVELVFETTTDLPVVITDLNGKQVCYDLSGHRQNLTIDLSGEPSGIYLVSVVEFGRLVGTKRIILNP